MSVALLKKKRIYQVDAPPETIDQWKTVMDKDKRKFEGYFKNDRELEFFCMLPLTATQRLSLLQTLSDARKLEKEIEECDGRPDTTKDHRNLCIACVTRHRPLLAIQYY